MCRHRGVVVAVQGGGCSGLCRVRALYEEHFDPQEQAALRGSLNTDCTSTKASRTLTVPEHVAQANTVVWLF